MDTKDLDYKLIGLQVRNYREAKSISQEQLAFQAGLSTTTIGKIERGLNNPKAETLLRIARELEIPCRLLFEKNDATKNLYSPQIQRLVQYARFLDDDEVNALCIMARILNHIDTDDTPAYPDRMRWNNTREPF